MANLLKGIAGLASAAYIGRQNREDDHARMNKYLVARGKAPLEMEKAPIDKAFDWIGEKFKSATSPGGPGAPDSPTAPAAGGETGLWDRLSAGNIDAPGSEAYNRWGQGKVDGDAAQMTREARRSSPESTPQDAPMESQLATQEQMPGGIDGLESRKLVDDLDESSRLESAQEGGYSPGDAANPVADKQAYTMAAQELSPTEPYSSLNPDFA